MPHNIFPWDVSEEFQRYRNEQLIFIDSLNACISEQVVVRLHSEWEYKNNSEDIFWEHNAPKVSLDTGETNFFDVIKNARLLVYSYDSTGILEALNLNFPVVGFWSSGVCNIRDSAVPYYKELFEANILFRSPEEAANHINSIWNEISLWWVSNTVQQARRNFIEEFSVNDTKPIRKLRRILLS